MRIVFVRGWILPHLALAVLLIVVVAVLPRYWKRFRVEPGDGRGVVALAFGMPSIVLMLRWAIRVELQLASFHDYTPAQVYFKWVTRAIVLLTIFLAVVVYVIRIVRVADGFSFLVLWAILISASLAALYFTAATQAADP